MRLVFHRDAEERIHVFHESDGKRAEFSYVAMIKSLINQGAMDPAEIEGHFTAGELESIKRMVDLINEAALAKAVDADDNDGSEADDSLDIPF